jgi:hypothetical protein
VRPKVGSMKLGRRHAEPYEFAALARYNAECARGIVHTAEWDALMRVEQAAFDAQRPTAGLSYPPNIRRRAAGLPNYPGDP